MFNNQSSLFKINLSNNKMCVFGTRHIVSTMSPCFTSVWHILSILLFCGDMNINSIFHGAMYAYNQNSSRLIILSKTAQN